MAELKAQVSHELSTAMCDFNRQFCLSSWQIFSTSACNFNPRPQACDRFICSTFQHAQEKKDSHLIRYVQAAETQIATPRHLQNLTYWKKRESKRWLFNSQILFKDYCNLIRHPSWSSEGHIKLSGNGGRRQMTKYAKTACLYTCTIHSGKSFSPATFTCWSRYLWVRGKCLRLTL